MPFLPSDASFPNASLATAGDRAAIRANAPRVSPALPAWARPKVPWPFLSAASLSSRRASPQPGAVTTFNI